VAVQTAQFGVGCPPAQSLKRLSFGGRDLGGTGSAGGCRWATGST
jgi:hypothetical protein